MTRPAGAIRDNRRTISGTVATILGSIALCIVAAACTTSSAPPKGSARGSSSRGSASPRGTAPAGTTAHRVRSSGATVERPDAFFGFNGASIVQSINVDLLLDPELQTRLAAFPTRLLRVPTGTAAQWIDWRTGRFIDNPTSPFAKIPADRHPVTMDDWARLVRTSRATPVWDLNVLTSTLDDQIAMLDEAVKLGLPVRFIELGNELWDVRSIYPTVYPSGADYARAMNAWIPELRRRFPQVRIAVSGADPSDPFFSKVFGERYRDWNNQVLATIEGADAIAIHPYWTLPDRADPGSDVAATLVAGLDAWDDFTTKTLAPIPDGMGVWLTEWNQAAWGSKQGSQIWAQALSVLAVGMAQLTDDRIEMSLVHDIVDGETNPHDAGISITFPAFADGARGSQPLAPTALGHTLPLLFGAVAPGSTIGELVVEDVPELGEHGGVRGVRITGAEPGALFVNLTARSISIRLPRGMPGSWDVTIRSAPPDAEPGWVTGQEPRAATTSTAGVVDLPAYSVVRVFRR